MPPHNPHAWAASLTRPGCWSAQWSEGALELAGQGLGGVPLVGRGDELDVVAPGSALDVDVAHVDAAAVPDRLVLEHHRALAAGVGLVLGVADLTVAGEVAPRPGPVVPGRLGEGRGGVLGANGEQASGPARLFDDAGVVSLSCAGPEPGWDADAGVAGPILGGTGRRRAG